MVYSVTDIFGPTLQGEGHFVGYPALFVRLAGCQMASCSIRKECDEAPWAATYQLSADEIRDRLKLLSRSGIVVVTGGEPTDQDIVPLLSTLREAGYRLHIETNGQRPITGYPLEWITVSPKSPDYAQRTGHTLKVVVRPEWNISDVMAYSAGTQFFHRYLQPLAINGVPVNLEQVIDMVRGTANCARPNPWALSTQAHRLWGLP